MLYTSYRSDHNNETGTHYTQRIRATDKDILLIIELLHREYEQAQQIKNTQRIYTGDQMHKICYQKDITETPHETINKYKIKYFLNLTQFETIIKNYFDKNKRIKYANTILLLDYSTIK